MAPKRFYIYDLETLVNFFSFSGSFADETAVHSFEMSSRKNQRGELLSWLSYLQNSGTIMVGYNSLNFDYPIIHELLNNPYTFDYQAAYNQCQQIIGAQSYGFNTLRMSDRIIPQCDLVKINHFDNNNRRTSLKSLQFAMRSESVEDLPFKLGVPLESWQMDKMLAYNAHDVTETKKFFWKCKHNIDFRQELLDNGVLSGDVLNYSDVKIGTEYLVKKIGRNKCFLSGSKPRQTFRESISFNDIILPKIYYRTESFEQVLEWFKKQVIYVKSEDEPPKLKAHLTGLDFHFGVGGVHASVEGKKYETTNTHVIKDIDVSGMYPRLSVVNGFCPEHLGKDFLEPYAQMQIDRHQYVKGTPMNKTLKLANNGAFGNSDNPFSCFYDPRMAKQITINGQLQLLQLAEMLSQIPGLDLIQCNTDGITAYLPRNMEPFFNLWIEIWEQMTSLELEEVEYSKMWIRDVNNYLAVTTKGTVKRKGAYWYPETDADYDGVWNKDFSEMIVQKAIGQVLIEGWNPEAVVRLSTNSFDFMKRYKTTGSSKVFIGEKEMLKTVRYYVSTAGEPMRKVAPPKGKLGEYKRKGGITDKEFDTINATTAPGTWDARIHTKNKSKYDEVVTGIEAGRLVKECNKASDFNWDDVDYDYYIKEIQKLEI